MFFLSMQHQRLNLTYPMTKEQLKDAAESSGISQKPIKGTGGPVAQSFGNPNGKQYHHDGWSNFKLLVNKDPPLVQTWTNPMKIRLTPEVGLHHHANSLSCTVSVMLETTLLADARWLGRHLLLACSHICAGVHHLLCLPSCCGSAL